MKKKIRLETLLYENDNLIDQYRCIATLSDDIIFYTDSNRHKITIKYSDTDIEIDKSGVISYTAYHKEMITSEMNIEIDIQGHKTVERLKYKTNVYEIRDNENILNINIEYQTNESVFKLQYKLGG